MTKQPEVSVLTQLRKTGRVDNNIKSILECTENRQCSKCLFNFVSFVKQTEGGSNAATLMLNCRKTHEEEAAEKKRSR